MFQIIFCFLPILFVFFQFYLLKKQKSVSFDIKKGHICYNCKQDLNISEKDLWDRMLRSDDFSKLCISCSRDRKIFLLKNPILIFKYKFQKFMISNGSEKLHWVFLLIVASVIILDFILKLFGIISCLWLLYGSLNIIWWSIITYKTYYTTIKKPSE